MSLVVDQTLWIRLLIKLLAALLPCELLTIQFAVQGILARVSFSVPASPTQRHRRRHAEKGTGENHGSSVNILENLVVVVFHARFVHVRVLDLGRHDTRGVLQHRVTLELVLELPFAVEVAGLPHKGNLVQCLSQVGFGLVDLGLEVAQAPDAVLAEQVHEFVDEHVFLDAGSAGLFERLSACLDALDDQLVVRNVGKEGARRLTLSTLALSLMLMNGMCFLDGSSSPVAKMACSRSGIFSSSAACLFSSTKYSSFLTGTASNSFVMVPAMAVCLGIGRRAYGVKRPLFSFFFTSRLCLSYRKERPCPGLPSESTSSHANVRGLYPGRSFSENTMA